MTSTTNIPSGFLGSLNPSQEEKLREFWTILLKSWTTNETDPDATAKATAATSGGAVKSHRRFFSWGRLQPQTEEYESSAIPPKMLASLKSMDASSQEIKAIQSLLTDLHDEKLRLAYLSILKQDHPDALLLRFLRAEKWNVPKAWIKLVNALNWRVNEYKVDEEILQKGEAYALDKSQNGGEEVERKDGEGFMLQLHTGKGHYHGVDRVGRPICIVRVRLHNPSEQTAKALNDYIIHCIETARIMLVPPVESLVSIRPCSVSLAGRYI